MANVQKIVFGVWILVTGSHALAQADRIDTDRPDQTESAVLVPKNYFQGEFGIGKENLQGSNFTLIHPGFLLKYGWSKRFELRLESQWVTEYVQLIPDPKTNSRLEPVAIGTKIALFEEDGLLPKTSLIINVATSFNGKVWNQPAFYPSFRFTCQHSITEKFGLGYNIGAEDSENGSALLYTFSPNFNPGKRWYTYMEIFGSREQHSVGGAAWYHALDAGVAFYISNNSKLDLSGGLGLGGNPMSNYVALGFSFRFPVR